MDLFKSVFSEDDDDHQQSDPSNSQPSLESTPSSSSWSFGGLIKTLATKSESVIGPYRRDFEELGSGLKKETSIIRQVASRAVEDFPQSLEIGATVAQESLESVGQAIDDIGATLWKSTAQIISHGRESLLSEINHDSDSFGNNNVRRNPQGLDVNVKPYSRFEMQLRVIQGDKGTYCREPEDSGDFDEWRKGFVLEEKGEEIEGLMSENEVIREIYGEVVPGEVDRESFWSWYFYRVHKLHQAEEARAKLVKRVISGEEEEDLRWDLEDEDEDQEGNGSSSKDKENLKDGENAKDEEKEESGSDKAVLVDRVENSESSCKDSDISVVSTQPSLPGEEELGWDDIEDDVKSNDGNKKVDRAEGSAEKADWRKRLSVAGEEEDLSWDIEDDDYEPAKP